MRDDVWPRSWADDFVDYARWAAAGEPDGDVWGSNWSDAIPGLSIIEDSSLADSWSQRIGHFFEVMLETDRFSYESSFDDLRHRKISDDTSTISKTIVPLPVILRYVARDCQARHAFFPRLPQP